MDLLLLCRRRGKPWSDDVSIYAMLSDYAVSFGMVVSLARAVPHFSYAYQGSGLSFTTAQTPKRRRSTNDCHTAKNSTAPRCLAVPSLLRPTAINHPLTVVCD